MLAIIVGCAPAIDKDEVHRDVISIWNEGKLDLVDKYYAEDFIYHSPGQEDIKGIEAYKSHIIQARKAFPDIKFTVEEMVLEGDKLASRWTFSGTNTGPLQGGKIPATGKKVTVTGMSLTRIKNGKAVEEFSIADTLGELQQLGLIPAQ
jgi:steroid delta-isomerase-like uncharacterized protein